MLMNEIKMPVQKRSIERLEKVIQTTIDLLETKTLAECNIQEISQISGVPRNHIYQYFPTIDHLFSLIVNRYFQKLQSYLTHNAQLYKTWSVLDIIQDALSKASTFYNQNKPASMLILGGPVNIEGFSLHEAVIEEISKEFVKIFTQKKNPLTLKKPDDITIMIELIFALMKHSFYRNGYITEELQQEALLVCEAYLEKKTYI